jgi:uncharacterized protein (TIGR03437 family)
MVCLFLGATAAWAQGPKITNFTTGVPGDNLYGPGTFLIILGTFTTPSAGRDYTITVGGQSSGINVAANGVFIAADIPANAAPGPTTLVITYQGQASNALPITIAALAPEIQGLQYAINGPMAPPMITYTPFTHNSNSQFVTPVSPAALGEVLQMVVSGLGSNVAPTVAPTVTIGGQNAQVLQVNPGSGRETIYFGVPQNAPLGIDPVVVTVNGVSSLPENLPVGIAPAIAAVVNGASFGSSGVVAPGSIVSVFGAGFGTQNNLSAFPSTSVNGLSVLFGSTPAPVFALAATGGQINVLVPSELPSSGTVNVTVQTSGGSSPSQTVNLAAAAPGMFYYNDPLVLTRRNAVAVTANTSWIAMPLSMAAGMGLPVTCSSAATVCGQPAKRGGYLQIYATGLGKATPGGDPNGAVLPTGTLAPASGNPLYLTVATPTVTIGGQPAPVLFSGLGPGYDGLYQVNVQIPANITPGDDVPLVISMAGASDSATVAIQ